MTPVTLKASSPLLAKPQTMSILSPKWNAASIRSDASSSKLTLVVVVLGEDGVDGNVRGRSDDERLGSSCLYFSISSWFIGIDYEGLRT